MKKFPFLFIVFTLSLFLSSCCGKKKATAAEPTTETTQPSSDFEKNGFVKATVINYEVDGCGFMLQLEDGKKLQANQLAPEFMKDKLAVWIKYAPIKGGMNICMAGQMVSLSEIQLRK